MFFIRLTFRFLSAIFPKLAAKLAFRMFQKVRKKDIRAREAAFFEKSTEYSIPFNDRELTIYELGNPNGSIAILLHGWDSNAGSLSMIANELVDRKYRIVTFNMPGHAFDKETYTNLFVVKNAMEAVLLHLNPLEKIHVITHSFGSAVAAYALSEVKYRVDKIIFLTSPNKIIDIFREFQSMINLGESAFIRFCAMATKVLGEDVTNLEIAEKLKHVDYNSLTIIHDKSDKVIPFSNAIEIQDKNPATQIVEYNKVGHYRMLWTEQIIGKVVSIIEQ